MKDLRTSAIALLVFTLLLGVGYPLLTTVFAQAAFHHQAEGSLIEDGDRVIGSELIGQAFSDPKYFWGRPSATAPVSYNGLASTGTNLGPLSPALVDAVKARITALRAADPSNHAAVPIDLVTASASGLDPHISPAAAYYQVARVARARGLSEADVRAVVDALVEPRQLGLLGEPRVNVVGVNRALDARTRAPR